MRQRPECPGVTPLLCLQKTKFTFLRCAIFLKWEFRKELFSKLAWGRGLGAENDVFVYMVRCGYSQRREEETVVLVTPALHVGSISSGESVLQFLLGASAPAGEAFSLHSGAPVLSSGLGGHSPHTRYLNCVRSHCGEA